MTTKDPGYLDKDTRYLGIYITTKKPEYLYKDPRYLGICITTKEPAKQSAWKLPAGIGNVPGYLPSTWVPLSAIYLGTWVPI